MLSRVANSIFWMTRYIERAENTARFLEVNQNLSLDTSGAIDQQWMPLIETSGDKELFEERYGEATARAVKQFLICDEQYPNSILSCVRAARENARTVRETISQPMWEEVNKFYLFLQDEACEESKQAATLDNPAEMLKEVRRTSHTIHGLTNATMTHDDAFHVARLGRLLERAEKTSRILDVKYYILLPGGKDDVGSPLDSIQWAALLKSASALHMYRRRHGRIDPNTVAEFLLLDRQFPRSVRSCLVEAEESLHKITGSPMGEFSNRPEQLLGRLRSELDFTDYATFQKPGMHEAIDSLQTRINEIGDAIHNEFFAMHHERVAERNGQPAKRPPMTQSMGSMSQSIGSMSQSMS